MSSLLHTMSNAKERLTSLLRTMLCIQLLTICNCCLNFLISVLAQYIWHKQNLNAGSNRSRAIYFCNSLFRITSFWWLRITKPRSLGGDLSTQRGKKSFFVVFIYYSRFDTKSRSNQSLSDVFVGPHAIYFFISFLRESTFGFIKITLLFYEILRCVKSNFLISKSHFILWNLQFYISKYCFVNVIFCFIKISKCLEVQIFIRKKMRIQKKYFKLNRNKMRFQYLEILFR